MSSHDLLTIQQLLKKTILAHQIAVSKLKTDPQNTVLQKELHELQKNIKKLSDEQKIAVQQYREQIILKETQILDKNENKSDNGVINNNNLINNNSTANNINIIGNKPKPESIKTINSRQALIIPQLGNKQSVAINTQSIKRPALAIKSVTGQTQFLVPVQNSSLKNKLLVVPKQKVLNYLKPVVKMPSLSSSSTLSSNSLKLSQNAQQLNSKSILIRSNSNSNNKTPNKVPLIKSLTNRSAPKLTDKQIKDHFMISLGLVTKEALTELQSRKCERKRRTTANPQFSSAALEAKRITKLEIAERKAKRKLLITNSTETNVTETKTTYLSNGISNKKIVFESQEISPGVHIVTSIGNFPSNKCFVCDELCECDSDSILFCKYCRTLFHATCSKTKADITITATVPCPKCESIKKKSDERIAKKREIRDHLLERKREIDEQMTQMKDTLNKLMEKLKVKSDEKSKLLSNQSEVQQKVDKITDTLKLIEDTSEWEDGFQAALDATAPVPKGDDNNNEESIVESSDQIESEAMDAETEQATNQLEQLVKAETDAIEMETDASDIYQLECHENGTEMYELFVEEVREESVDIVSENIGFFDSDETHCKSNDFSTDDNHVILY